MIKTEHFTLHAVATSPASPVPEVVLPKGVTLVSFYLNETALENGESGVFVFEFEDIRVYDDSSSLVPWKQLPEEYKDLLIVLDLNYNVTSELLVQGKKYIPYAIAVLLDFDKYPTLAPVTVAAKYGDTTHWFVPALDSVTSGK